MVPFVAADSVLAEGSRTQRWAELKLLWWTLDAKGFFFNGEHFDDFETHLLIRFCLPKSKLQFAILVLNIAQIRSFFCIPLQKRTWIAVLGWEISHCSPGHFVPVQRHCGGDSFIYDLIYSTTRCLQAQAILAWQGSALWKRSSRKCCWIVTCFSIKILSHSEESISPLSDNEWSPPRPLEFSVAQTVPAVPTSCYKKYVSTDRRRYALNCNI